ncbi:endonuclease/exonuclease/phosphatase family protein [Arthrobacter sp. CDRTa11]|uniref:endonuclease/exonuclease/phosphatase family protein n=1 Tax=Arthrobacter sp. CDRTa11 TaxID=2651199 RepID=UPI002265DCB2|nr:endonuclease/exonuclease/phosphatase family protein [Arthrobacter sp. CDRTa11]UZX03646.1 endonuclease/exonuclease/phosphatase family protein [Arthrobacter sp. CDRTa11]
MESGGTNGRRQFRRSSAFCWVIAFLLCLPGAGLTAVRLVPWDLGTPWIQLLSVFPATVMVTLVSAMVALLAVWLDFRRSRTLLAAVVAGVLVVQLGMVLPRVLPEGGMDPEAAAQAASADAGRELTVMALNVGPPGVDAGAILAEARARKVDVLALPELAHASLESLDQAGVAAEFSHRALDVDWAGTGSGIFSRFPLQTVERVPGSVFYQSRAVATIPGGGQGLYLTAVHVDSPRPGHTPYWRAELRQLGELRRDMQGSPPVILLGDFNAGHDHREFRALLDTGLTDAAASVGKGLAPTWPQNSRIPPFVALDHVLVSPGITVLTFDTVKIAGTDHSAVVATLSLPR